MLLSIYFKRMDSSTVAACWNAHSLCPIVFLHTVWRTAMSLFSSLGGYTAIGNGESSSEMHAEGLIGIVGVYRTQRLISLTAKGGSLLGSV
jgi:hypothetical protein